MLILRGGRPLGSWLRFRAADDIRHPLDLRRSYAFFGTVLFLVTATGFALVCALDALAAFLSSVLAADRCVFR